MRNYDFERAVVIYQALIEKLDEKTFLKYEEVFEQCNDSLLFFLESVNRIFRYYFNENVDTKENLVAKRFRFEIVRRLRNKNLVLFEKEKNIDKEFVKNKLKVFEDKNKLIEKINFLCENIAVFEYLKSLDFLGCLQEYKQLVQHFLNQEDSFVLFCKIEKFIDWQCTTQLVRWQNTIDAIKNIFGEQNVFEKCLSRVISVQLNKRKYSSKNVAFDIDQNDLNIQLNQNFSKDVKKTLKRISSLQNKNFLCKLAQKNEALHQDEKTFEHSV